MPLVGACLRLALGLLLCTLLPLPADSRPLLPNSRSLQGSTHPVWNAFSFEAHSLQLGPALLGRIVMDSDASCAQQCAATVGCRWWARCSEESAAPCSLPRYGASTTQQPPATVQPGTCLLSGELVADLSDLSTSFSFMWGDSVEWSSGGTLTPPSISAPQTQPAASEPIWANFTHQQGTLYRGARLLASATATTAARRNQLCQQWAWCPSAAAGGCDVLEYTQPGTAAATTALLPAGTCLLSRASQASSTRNSSKSGGHLAFLFMSGPSVAWEAGHRRSAAPLKEPYSLYAGSDSACDAGITSCGGECVDLMGDSTNCGILGMFDRAGLLFPIPSAASHATMVTDATAARAQNAAENPRQTMNSS
ncbi:hypothetical protein ACK3TF_004439 [Chlorella vulgaris]